MNCSGLIGATLSSLFLVGCISTPLQRDDPSLSAAIAKSAIGAPRLPSPGESYLDPSWFEQTLTADRAVQTALLNNPRVRGQLSRLDGAQAERVQAGLISNPMLTLMALRPEGGGRYELDYSLMQSLFDLITRSRRIIAADAAQRRVEAEVLLALLSFAQDTEAAYYDSLAAQDRLAIARQRLAFENSNLLLLQRQRRQGVVTASTALEQQAVTSMRAHEAEASEAELSRARSNLARLLGLASAAQIRLPEDLPPLLMAGLDGPTLQALAAANRPELRVADAGVDQARAELNLQTGALRTAEPSLGLAGARERDGFWLNGLELQVYLPVFDTGLARSASAKSQVAQAEYSAEAIRREVPLEVERALATLASAQLAADHADHHLQQQRLLEKLAQKNYAQGSSDLLLYRQSSQARLLSSMDALSARQTLWTAFIDLQRATGVAAISQ